MPLEGRCVHKLLLAVAAWVWLVSCGGVVVGVGVGWCCLCFLKLCGGFVGVLIGMVVFWLEW